LTVAGCIGTVATWSIDQVGHTIQYASAGSFGELDGLGAMQ
jgi:hypothetical protein